MTNKKDTRKYAAKYLIAELALLKGAYSSDLEMFGPDGKPVSSEELASERAKEPNPAELLLSWLSKFSLYEANGTTPKVESGELEQYNKVINAVAAGLNERGVFGKIPPEKEAYSPRLEEGNKKKGPYGKKTPADYSKEMRVSEETRRYAADLLISDLISVRDAFPRESLEKPYQGNAEYANMLVNWLVNRQFARHPAEIRWNTRDGEAVEPKKLDLTSYDAAIGEAIKMFKGYGITNFAPKVESAQVYSEAPKPSDQYSSARS